MPAGSMLHSVVVVQVPEATSSKEMFGPLPQGCTVAALALER